VVSFIEKIKVFRKISNMDTGAKFLLLFLMLKQSFSYGMLIYLKEEVFGCLFNLKIDNYIRIQGRKDDRLY
jgi:hypothetical protein